MFSVYRKAEQGKGGDADYDEEKQYAEFKTSN